MFRVPLFVSLVVMAGCVDLVHDGFRRNEAEEAPAVPFTGSETDDSIVIGQTPAHTSWADFNITGDRTATFRLNDGAMHAFNASAWTRVGTIDMHAGDKLDFCSDDKGEIQVRIMHAPTNTLMHVFTFEAVTTHEWCL